MGNPRANSDQNGSDFDSQAKRAQRSEDVTLGQTVAVGNAAEPESSTEERRVGGGTASADDLPETFGRYCIRKMLGRGAMGGVYLADDTQLKRPVALKIPTFSESASNDRIQRFYREARSAARLSHPNICPIYDVGEHEGTTYISMGYVEGQPLSAHIEAGEIRSQGQAAAIVRKLALALQEAHDKGVIHRDLKPANIMIDRRDEPIVLDFGLALEFGGDEDARLTKPGVAIGSPAYMSPEQVEGGENLGPATDIYSLGVILYELLAGSPPFQGPLAKVLRQILHTDPPPVNELRSDISPILVEICQKALAKKPEDRYASMDEFASALTKFLTTDAGNSTVVVPATRHTERSEKNERTTTAVASIDPQSSGAGVRAASLSATDAMQFGRASSRLPWMIAGAAIGTLGVVAGIGIAVALLRGTGKERPAAATPAPADNRAAAPSNQPDDPLAGFAAGPKRLGPGDPQDGTGRFGPGGLDGRPTPPPEHQFSFYDRDENGKIDSEEGPQHLIERADQNDDGQLSDFEFQDAHRRLGPSLFDPPGEPPQNRDGNGLPERRPPPPPRGRPNGPLLPGKRFNPQDDRID